MFNSSRNVSVWISEVICKDDIYFLQVGLKASFSRPPTGPPNEEEQYQRANQDAEVVSGVGLDGGKRKEPGVLLTEIDYDSDNEGGVAKPAHVTINEVKRR